MFLSFCAFEIKLLMIDFIYKNVLFIRYDCMAVKFAIELICKVGVCCDEAKGVVSMLPWKYSLILLIVLLIGF